MFSTLNRYFSKELAQTFAGVSTVLLLVIVGQSFVSLLAKVMKGKLPADVVVSMLGLGILKSAILLIPFALLLTIMLTLGRYYRDSEIYAIKASGIGSSLLLRYASLIFIPLIAFLFYLSIYSAPWAEQQIETIKQKARGLTDIYSLTPGQFIESNQGNWVIFVEQSDRESGEVKNVFIYDRKEGNVAIETARHAEQKNLAELGGESLILKKGQRYEGTPGEGGFTLLSFDQHAVRIPEFDLNVDIQDPEFKSTTELLESKQLPDIAEFQWRISVPIAAILLALLAFPLSVTNPRQGRFAGLAIAIVIYLIYSNLLILAETWVADGKLHTVPGMFAVHAAMLVLVIILSFRRRLGA
ncbi:MAG: LPS export ABC transporter permease LptF [Gammaproteobacteria bacterium]|nr:LPS export ABC transporter permease LptF [Gammaproteobacteria bacterium]NNC69034.1 LPS export ABC transporter permease LptF [Gammaproteobacteria bacterium]